MQKFRPEEKDLFLKSLSSGSPQKYSSGNGRKQHGRLKMACHLTGSREDPRASLEVSCERRK